MINIKNLLLGIAIFILTLFVGIYGISTLYAEAPEYNDFCPYEIINETQCVAEGGTWMEDGGDITSEGKPVPAGRGYCAGFYEKCQEEFDTAMESHQRKVFFIALPLGIIIIAAGALIFGLEVVGAGLMAGGVGIILYGAGGYWQYAKDAVKFALSLIGLIAVVWLAYYANKRWNKK